MAERLAGYRRDRDHLDREADLEAAGGRVEGDHERDHRGERPWAEQAEQRSVRVGQVLDRDVGDPEQDPGRGGEQGAAMPPVRLRPPRRVEILTSPTPTARIALSKAISAARSGTPLRTPQRDVPRKADHHQSCCGERHAGPLTSSEVKAEMVGVREPPLKRAQEPPDRRNFRPRRLLVTVERGARAQAPRCAGPRRTARGSIRSRTTASETDRRRCATDGVAGPLGEAPQRRAP